jgi:protein gp37
MRQDQSGERERWTYAAKEDGGLHGIQNKGEIQLPREGEGKYHRGYPYGFDPTLHYYRLNEPQTWKMPRTIFVGSMCDLFASYVPDEWIAQVFAACEAAPQHRYIFLTKNAKRYDCLSYMLSEKEKHGNWWIGASATTQAMFDKQAANLDFYGTGYNAFVSCEPLLEPIELDGLGEQGILWVIVGAETGNRKGKIIPEKEWIDEIVQQCKEANIPVFMKDSLKKIIPEHEFLQQFPWEVEQ